MRTLLRRWSLFVGRLTVYATCGFVSLFILASGYESVYNRPLPFVHTLEKVNLAVLAKSYDLHAAATLKTSVFGDFGKPSTLTIPGAQGALRLSIVTPVENNDTWLAKASSVHMLVPTPPLDGNISTQILYCRAGFRTIGATPLPKVGTNLFVDTDQNWRYVYKVTTARTYVDSYPYAPTENGAKGKIIIFCADAEHKTNNIIEGDIISVQAVTR